MFTIPCRMPNFPSAARFRPFASSRLCPVGRCFASPRRTSRPWTIRTRPSRAFCRPGIHPCTCLLPFPSPSLSTSLHPSRSPFHLAKLLGTCPLLPSLSCRPSSSGCSLLAVVEKVTKENTEVKRGTPSAGEIRGCIRHFVLFNHVIMCPKDGIGNVCAMNIDQSYAHRYRAGAGSASHVCVAATTGRP